MTSSHVPTFERAQPLLRLSFERPVGVRLLLTRLLNAALACMVVAALVSAAYLCKCKMGIDMFEGPSCLHNALYWMVR